MTGAPPPGQEQTEGASVEFRVSLDERGVSFPVDESVYPIDAVYGAAYVFVDRCHVFLDRAGERAVRVQLRPREAVSGAELEALAGEFANELLNQVVRLRVAESTARVREAYLARAFFADQPRSNIDAILAELDAEDLDEDPLEIRVPWERAPKEGEPPE